MKPAYQTFITEMLRHGDKERAYKAAYPKAQGRALTSAANRLLANPEIATVINETHNRIRAEAEAEVKTMVTEELLTLQRVKQLLTQIAEGRHTVEKQVRTKGGSYEIIDVKPTESQVLTALRLYCRLEGWIMPVGKTAPPSSGQREPRPRIVIEPMPVQVAIPEPVKQYAPPVQPQPIAPVPVLTIPHETAIVSTEGYTKLSDILQDSWDVYIRNQTPDNWRRYQASQKLNQRNLPKQDRTAIAASLGWECHPQDVMYYKRKQMQANNPLHNHQGRHFERS